MNRNGCLRQHTPGSSRRCGQPASWGPDGLLCPRHRLEKAGQPLPLEALTLALPDPDELPTETLTAAETAELAATAAPIARLSATCGAPPRRTARRAPPAGQAALLVEADPRAMVAFDGTVYIQADLF